MANPDHVEIVELGAEGIKEWRESNPDLRLDLSGADLEGVDLSEANLSETNLSHANLRGADLRKAYLSDAILIDVDLSKADLTKANLSRANLYKVDLSKANLSGTIMCGADLSEANMQGANISKADLSAAILRLANLCEADLTKAILSSSNLTEADLSSANLSKADLNMTILNYTHLEESNLKEAEVYSTAWVDLDLSKTLWLETIRHQGPSSLGVDTLMKSKGQIPKVFLRGCGLSDWEIQVTRLYDQSLTANEISNLLVEEIMSARTEGPLFLGGTFISYSQKDSEFVDKLYQQLQDAGARCWLDKHDLLAGSIEKQIFSSIRVQDIVVLVLSENSINSDWVEAELEAARKKEIEEKRDVLCPIALDDSWKKKVKDSVLWRQVAKSNILDFSYSDAESFDSQFRKLINGMKINYTINNF